MLVAKAEDHADAKDYRSKKGTPIDELLTRLRRNLEAKLGPLTAAEGKLKAVFAKMDENGDGKISRREMVDRLNELQVGLSVEDVGLLFSAYDVDNSGFISYDVRPVTEHLIFIFTSSHINRSVLLYLFTRSL